LIENKSLINFTCDAASSWVIITPKLGCHFQDWNVQQGGQAITSYSTSPCKCQCSGQKKTCGRGEGSWVYWPNVQNHEDCAKMICSNDRYSQCTYEDTVVASDGDWNGDKVKFHSISLQETCKGLSGTSKDFCGVVGHISALEDVSPRLSWIVKTADGTEITRYNSDVHSFGVTSRLSARAVWLPCGVYTINYTDESWAGHGWDNTILTLKDDQGYEVWRSSIDLLQSPDGRTFSENFIINEVVIAQARTGLCSLCRGQAQPCFWPNDATADSQTCTPFVPGTTECPFGAMKCDSDVLAH